MTLNELRNRLSSLQDELVSFVRIAFEENEDKVMELQRIQLFAGKRADGQDIRPYYSEDLKENGGFFRSVQSAMSYARFKAEKIDYPVSVPRQFDAPNLYINGRFHSELGVEIDDSTMLIRGLSAYADKIVEKYGYDTFGLSEESMGKIMPIIKERINEQLKAYING